MDDTADYEAVFGAEVLGSKPFLNIGAGDWQHALWSNVDYVQPPYDQYTPPRYNIDLGILTPLPIEDQSIFLVYTCHTVEHLTTEQLRYWFSEVYRVMAPGGVLRIVTPEIETAYWAYLLGDMRYYDQRYTAGIKGEQIGFRRSSGFGQKFGSLPRAFLARFASCLGNPEQMPDFRGEIVAH